MERGSIKKYAAFGLILVLFLVIAIGLLNYFKAIFAACIFAPIFYPIYQKIRKHFESDTGAALLTIFVMLLILIVPALFLGISLFHETADLYTQYDTALQQDITHDFSFDVKKLSNQAVEYGVSQLGSSLGDILSRLTQVGISLFIMFFVCFYLLIHGEHAEELLKKWLPFTKEHNGKLIEQFKRSSRGFIVGQGLTAVVQGVVGGIGFAIFGLDGAIFFGFLTAVLALLPFIGTALIWLPIGIVQILTGNYFGGFGILIWGVLIISNIDNFIRPMIMKNMIGVHPLISVLGIFSGLIVFGLVGLIIGPLFLTLAIEAATMFRKEWYG